MKIVNGEWAFPDADDFMVSELGGDGTYQLSHLEAALTHVTNRFLAIDGGAHIGTWSKILSGHFERVIAVEPSPDTFECLQRNLTFFGCSNVVPMNIAIGAAAGSVEIALDAANAARKNTGARHVVAGGSIPMETIDSWNLQSLGFLKLDIEGSELAALQGAKATLRRCQPIVLFEDKGLWKRHFGLKRDAVQRFLTAVGYREVERTGCDAIWSPAR